MGAAATDCPAPSDSIDDDRLLGSLGDPKCWPPGFRFHPTDEELILFYLKRKVCRRRIRLAMIGDVDVYKWEPNELPERSVLRSGDKQWFFFSPRDRKYPNGSRSNRTTRCGYWKATGKDRTISQKSRPVGYKKTLVYHQGRAPKGQRTDWVMYEYTLDEQVLANYNNVQDSYALYKVFRKSGPGPKNGEQYGAPFREEEWNDDADEPDDGLGIQDERVESVTGCSPGAPAAPAPAPAPVVCNDEDVLEAIDLEEVLGQLSREQDAISRDFQFPTYAPEVDVESELASLLMGPSYANSSITRQSIDGWCEQDSISTNFHIPQPDSAYTHPIETPEVTSINNTLELDHVLADEGFLEIRDFNGPDPPIWSMDNINHQEDIHDTNEFYDPSDYFDPAMVLDAASIHSYLETQNQEADINSVLWAHEQVALSSPASGALNNAENASESWFNSALAALLNSVPSPPAIASENALITRAIERVSSFKAGHDSTSIVGGGGGRRPGGRNRGGILFISFLVGLGAILWVLIIGAAVKFMRSMWGRFVTS